MNQFYLQRFLNAQDSNDGLLKPRITNAPK